MASMKKVGERNGEGVYRIRWRADGRLTEKWVHGHERAKAVKLQIESDAHAGRSVDPRVGTNTLDAYFAEWLPARLVKGRPLRASTRQGYERLWKRNIAPLLGKRQLRALRPETIRKWYGEVTTQSGQDQAAKSYRLLHAVLETAETDELIRLNPCRIRGAGQEHADERPMIPTAMVLDLVEAIGPRYGALLLTMGFCSLRTGEVFGLRRCDVDPLHGEVHVLVQAQELTGMGRTVLDHAKTDAGLRTVSVPSFVMDVLVSHMADYTAPEPEAPVFTGPRNTPLRRATFSDAWIAAKEKVGAAEDLRPYDLRHHAGTVTARMPGITTKELMARLGHTSWRAALRYQHATAERDRKVANFLDEQIASVEREPKAPVVGLPNATRGAGVGLDTGERKRRRTKKAS
jgi:integrase